MSLAGKRLRQFAAGDKLVYLLNGLFNVVTGEAESAILEIESEPVVKWINYPHRCHAGQRCYLSVPSYTHSYSTITWWYINIQLLFYITLKTTKDTTSKQLVWNPIISNIKPI